MPASFDGANRPITWGELVDLLARMEFSPEVSAAKELKDIATLSQAIGELSPYNAVIYPPVVPATGEVHAPPQKIPDPFMDEPEYLPCRLALCACAPACGKCGTGKMWDAGSWPGQHNWCCARCGASGVVTRWQKLSEMSADLQAITEANLERVIKEREGPGGVELAGR